VPLTLRPTGASSPADADRTDYTVFEDERAVGRIYEDRDAPPGWRWLWSITDPHAWEVADIAIC
jgi:hypothetical protein